MDDWSLLLEAARTSSDHVGPAGAGFTRVGGRWQRDDGGDPGLYLPLLDDRVQVIAHLAQSLDGRIALPDGASRWISGDADLEHTHRLRAPTTTASHSARTIAIDDPQLT